MNSSWIDTCRERCRVIDYCSSSREWWRVAPVRTVSWWSFKCLVVWSVFVCCHEEMSGQFTSETAWRWVHWCSHTKLKSNSHRSEESMLTLQKLSSFLISSLTSDERVYVSRLSVTFHSMLLSMAVLLENVSLEASTSTSVERFGVPNLTVVSVWMHGPAVLPVLIGTRAYYPLSHSPKPSSKRVSWFASGWGCDLTLSWHVSSSSQVSFWWYVSFRTGTCYVSCEVMAWSPHWSFL